jgi:hypothetical protein
MNSGESLNHSNEQSAKEALWAEKTARDYLGECLPSREAVCFAERLEDDHINAARAEVVGFGREIFNFQRVELDGEAKEEADQCMLEALHAIDGAVDEGVIPIRRDMYEQRINRIEYYAAYPMQKDYLEDCIDAASGNLDKPAKVGTYHSAARTIFLYGSYRMENTPEQTRHTATHEMMHALSAEWVRASDEDYPEIATGVPDVKTGRKTEISFSLDEALTEIAAQRILNHHGLRYDPENSLYFLEVLATKAAASKGLVDIGQLLEYKFSAGFGQEETRELLQEISRTNSYVEQEIIDADRRVKEANS